MTRCCACVVLCCACACVVLCCACAVLCCAVLCCAVMCCAVMCCAVLCRAVPCRAVLCCASWHSSRTILLCLLAQGWHEDSSLWSVCRHQVHSQRAQACKRHLQLGFGRQLCGCCHQNPERWRLACAGRHTTPALLTAIISTICSVL